MHQLFSRVLGQRDLSRAGDLFSLEDTEIKDCLSQALDQIKAISCSPVSKKKYNRLTMMLFIKCWGAPLILISYSCSYSLFIVLSFIYHCVHNCIFLPPTGWQDYLTNDNDQAVVEICITRITTAIRETGSIKQHSRALVGLWESCLEHNLTPQGENTEDTPHAKIASDITSCILQVHPSLHMPEIVWYGFSPGESYLDFPEAQTSHTVHTISHAYGHLKSSVVNMV